MCSTRKKKGIPNNSTQNELKDAPEKGLRSQERKKNISFRHRHVRNVCLFGSVECRNDRHQEMNRTFLFVSGEGGETRSDL